MPAPFCRLIVDPEPQSGSVNMAIDGALLRAAVANPAAPVVRVYQWSEPTVSLGYFQKNDPSPASGSLESCPRVQRMTGGGAILHHHELTYSCTIPRTHPLRHEPLRLYHVMHRVISDVLRNCGAHVGFRGDVAAVNAQTGTGSDRQSVPFLCFLRSDPRDLVAVGDQIRGYPKVTGSAQRRRRGTILQHGSILLRSSPLLPELPGIMNLFPEFNLSDFSRTLPELLAGSVCDDQILSEYTVQEQHLAFESLEAVSTQ